jgi:DNA-binding CsgD family transcriptional regulator
MIINPNKHIFITSTQEINQIIQPLKEFFGLTSFVYQKNFNDGSEIRLSNQPEWICFFYEKELYKDSLFERHPSEFTKARILWSGLSTHNSILDKARSFNIDHGITFVEPCEDGCEFFFIGTEVKNHGVMSKYLAHLDLLGRFLDYFREKAKPLITKAMSQRVIIPDKFDNRPKILLQPEINRTKFLQSLNPIEFTPRELDCMHLLTKGYTQKMIAKELAISPRTVETHLNHVKDKTATTSKGELIKYLLKYFIL